MSTSPTKDVTIFPNAAPMTTPTARSTTFPRVAKALNSWAIPAIDASARSSERPEWLASAATAHRPPRLRG